MEYKTARNLVYQTPLGAIWCQYWNEMIYRGLFFNRIMLLESHYDSVSNQIKGHIGYSDLKIE